MVQFSTEKERFIEELGVYFEKRHHLPPLAARIYAILRLCPKNGHTFDEIVEFSHSSKGSVSTNLNLLLNVGSVEYFTLPGERKRYFRLSKHYLRVMLSSYRKEVEVELEYLTRINEFNRKQNPEKYNKAQCFGEIYREFLGEHFETLTKTIEKLIELEKQI